MAGLSTAQGPLVRLYTYSFQASFDDSKRDQLYACATIGIGITNQIRGGGQVVSMLAFYSENPSSNPADAYSFFCKILCLKRTKINQKEAAVGPFK